MIKKLISLIIAVIMVAELIGDKVLAEKVLAEGVYYIESVQKVGHVIDTPAPEAPYATHRLRQRSSTCGTRASKVPRP